MMPRPNTIPATSRARAVAEAFIGIAIDLGRADEDATGVWADGVRRQLVEAEELIVRLKSELSKLPTSERRTA